LKSSDIFSYSKAVQQQACLNSKTVKLTEGLMLGWWAEILSSPYRIHGITIWPLKKNGVISREQKASFLSSSLGARSFNKALADYKLQCIRERFVLRSKWEN
jgi:hypothetical protein